MKIKLFIVFALIFVAFSVKSQTKHFIFIQTDDNQTFYVKTDFGLFSSTELGSVIIPNVEEGICKITIGFPQNKWKRTIYNLTVKNSDLAFLLKKSAENQWSLYDYYNFSLIEKADTSTSINHSSNLDGFSRMLSQVSNVNLDPVDFIQGKGGAELGTVNVSSQKIDSTRKDNKDETVLSNLSVVMNDTINPFSAGVIINDTSLLNLKSSTEDSLLISSKKKGNADTTSVSYLRNKDSIYFVAKNSDSLDNTANSNPLNDSLSYKHLVKDEDSLTVIKKSDSTLLEGETNSLVDFSINIYNSKKSDTILTSIKSISVNDSTSIIQDNKFKDSVLTLIKTDSTTAINFDKIESSKDTLRNTDTSIIKLKPTIDSVNLVHPFAVNHVILDTSRTENQSVKFFDTSKAEFKKATDSLKEEIELINKNVIGQNDTDVTSKMRIEESKAVNGENNMNSEKKELVFIENVSIQQLNPSLASKDTPHLKDFEDSKATVQTKDPESTISSMPTAINCMQVVDDTNFIRIRKLMAGAESDEVMISLALEQIENKCFTTIQIKNLGVLFYNDKGRYEFLVKAYDHVYDKNQFQSLQNLLSDEMIIDNFKQLFNNK